jgi:hypothetical protein
MVTVRDRGPYPLPPGRGASWRHSAFYTLVISTFESIEKRLFKERKISMRLYIKAHKQAITGGDCDVF